MPYFCMLGGMDTSTSAAETVIRELGGLTATARLFDIRPPSVFGWKATGIPSARLQTLRAWAQLPAGVSLPNPEIGPQRVASALRAAGLAPASSQAAA